MNKIRQSPEWLLVAAFTFLLISWGFKTYEKHHLRQTQTKVQQTQQQIRETLALEQLWDSKGLDQRIEELKKLIPLNQQKKFLQKKRTLEISLNNLEGRKLNRFLGKLGALPIQVLTLSVNREKERYSLECRCKW